MSAPSRIAIVGASLAGLRAAEGLRRKGFDGAVTLIGAEPHLPYDRPPLSKDVLRGEQELADIALRDSLDDLGLDLRLGVRATALDVAGRAVALEGGERVAFDAAVIATGATPRTLPGADGLAGVHVLRTIDDALALRAELERSPRVVVVGGGFIGAEVAAAARHRGLDVVILEALPAPLSRALGDEMGAACAALHADHGVDVRCNVAVEGFMGAGRVEGVRLGDGTVEPADVVVVGIGVVPNTGWLEGSGLTIDNGVVCDETLLAAPGIVAAGDVARWPSRRFATMLRIEHWTNAVEQGLHAAERLLAADDAPPPVFDPVPYVWSDQYDTKIMFVGHSRPDDEVLVVNGSVEDRRFVALYGRAGRVVGALSMNDPRTLMKARRHIDAGTPWDEARTAL